LILLKKEAVMFSMAKALAVFYMQYLQTADMTVSISSSDVERR